MTERWALRSEGPFTVVEGEVEASSASAFASALASLGGDGPVQLELVDLELLDGVSVAEAVNAVRALARRRGPVLLRHAPQMLAHTLYKRGLLLQESLTLEDPRHDEGFATS